MLVSNKNSIFQITVLQTKSFQSKSSSGSNGRVRGAKKHEIYAASFGGHLFYDLFLQGWGGGSMAPLASPGSATEKKCVMWSRLFWPFWQVEVQVSWSPPSYWYLSLSLIGRWKSSPVTCYRHNIHLNTRTTTTVTMLSRCRSRDGVLRKPRTICPKIIHYEGHTVASGWFAPFCILASLFFLRHGYPVCV